MNIRIEEPVGDFYKKVWCFYVWCNNEDHVTVRFNHYIELKRETKRHKFVVTGEWGCHRRENNTFVEKPHVPAHIKNRVDEIILGGIEFC